MLQIIEEVASHGVGGDTVVVYQWAVDVVAVDLSVPVSEASWGVRESTSEVITCAWLEEEQFILVVLADLSIDSLVEWE